MKDETKKKIKKGALIALQVTLGGFALFGMISTGSLVKSCSNGEINTTAVVATTPVVGQRIKKLNANDFLGVYDPNYNLVASEIPSSALGKTYDLTFTYKGTTRHKIYSVNSSGVIKLVMPAQSSPFASEMTLYLSNSGWLSGVESMEIIDASGVDDFDRFNSFMSTFFVKQVTGIPLTADYAYCSPVGTLPVVVPEDYTSVTLQFQADAGYGFPDTGEEIPGYTQIYSEGLVIDSYQYGGYLGNGLYNAIEIQCSRDSDPPADSCHIAVSAIATEGFVYPEWKTLRVQGTHCTIYMADDEFDSEGVVRLQAYPDTGYYFDQDSAFIGNQLKEYYGAEVIMYDLSTGGLYLTVRKNTENLVVNQSPYIEITPLAGNVPVGGSEMGQAFDLLKDGFAALLPLFMIQVLPGITLGMLFMVPFIVILIMFILKVVHK